MSNSNDKKGLSISTASFITATVLIFVLMVLTYIMTFMVPGGEFARVLDENGNQIIDIAGGFTYIEGGIPFWKWILSPILVLGAEGNGYLIAVLVFLLVLGGVFNSLDRCGLMKYMLHKITARFAKHKYRLMAYVVLFFIVIGCSGNRILLKVRIANLI